MAEAIIGKKKKKKPTAGVKPVKKLVQKSTEARYYVVLVHLGKDPELLEYASEDAMFSALNGWAGLSVCAYPFFGIPYEIYGDGNGHLYVGKPGQEPVPVSQNMPLELTPLNGYLDEGM